MHQSRAVFKISDVFNHPLRNYRRFPGVYVIRNIMYDTRFGDSKNMLDIYLSPEKKKGKYPVIFNVHGGGFVGGGKKYRSGFARYFADKGWAVINVGYRLAPKFTFPSATEDCINALNFVNGLSEEHDLDLTKIVVTGDSAGGYYAAHTVAAITNDALRQSLNLPRYTGEKIRGFMGFYAPYDLLKCFTTPQLFDVTLDITNCVFGTDFDNLDFRDKLLFSDEQVNVVKNITANWPESFLIEAEKDAFCGNQAIDMGEALTKANIPHEIYIASENTDSHCTHLYPFLRSTKKMYEKVDKFVDRIYFEET